MTNFRATPRSDDWKFVRAELRIDVRNTNAGHIGSHSGMGAEDRNRSKQLVTRLDWLLGGGPYIAIRQLSHGRTTRMAGEGSDGLGTSKAPGLKSSRRAGIGSLTLGVNSWQSRHFVNHGDDVQQNDASHPKAAAFDLPAIKRFPDSSAFRMELDSRAVREITCLAVVHVRNGSIQAMRHQTALYFVPDLLQPGVELLSRLLVVHGLLLSNGFHEP
jgi:hypothetical protein